MRQINKGLKSEKRILLLMPEYVLGGAETQFRYLIEYAENQKWKMDVLIEHRKLMKDILLKSDMMRMKNINFYELNYSKKNSDLNLLFEIIKQLVKVFPNTKYCTCLIYYPEDLKLVPIFKLLRIRVIYSERKDAAGIIRNRYLRWNLKYCDRVLVNSKWAKKKIGELIGREAHLINNGKPVVEQLPVNENREIHRILMPARVNAGKNQMMLLQFLHDYPIFRGKVIFAGNIDDRSYKRKLMEFANRNGLQDKIEFLGYVKDMREQYERADIVVLPSLAEGTSNVVLEAYGYGRPVIVSDIEMERDIVKNPRLRFSLKDTSEIWQCIEYIRELSNEEYIELLEKNRKFVIQNYNIEKMARQFYKYLTEWNNVF